MKTFAEFFGFRADPFKRTPDIDFYYPTRVHQQLLDSLSYFSQSDDDFFVITGESGTGKTLTIRKFMSELPSNFLCSYILFPNLSAEELLVTILEGFGIKLEQPYTTNDLYYRIKEFILQLSVEDKQLLLVIDEAQNLPVESFEALRMLTNIETDSKKLVKVIMLGQADLILKLQSEALAQLRSRITLSSKLKNIEEDEIKEYINSHLHRTKRSPIKVQQRVIRRISKITHGNPRLINALMERAVIAAFLDNSFIIKDYHLTSAISSVNTIMSSIQKNKTNSYLKFLASAAVVALFILGGYFGFDYYQANFKGNTIIIAENNNLPIVPPVIEEPVIVLEPEPIEPADTTGETVTINTIPEVAVIDTPPEPAVNPNTFKPAPVDPETKPMPVGTRFMVLGSSLNVREHPFIESNRVGSVPGETEYYVLEEEPYWVKIRLKNGTFGWVYKKYLRTLD